MPSAKRRRMIRHAIAALADAASAVAFASARLADLMESSSSEPESPNDSEGDNDGEGGKGNGKKGGKGDGHKGGKGDGHKGGKGDGHKGGKGGGHGKGVYRSKGGDEPASSSGEPRQDTVISAMLARHDPMPTPGIPASLFSRTPNTPP